MNTNATRFLVRRPWLRTLVLLLATAGTTQAQATFSYTGGSQTYTVPAGVTALQVVATGGGGGTYTANGAATPAPGAVVQAVVFVTPGEVLTVVVGGQGGNGNNNGSGAGGFNGGGTGYKTGAGGGATDLRRAYSASTGTGDYLTTRNALVVAAGAGGGEYSTTAGGAGGTPTGGNGTGTGVPGLGATQAAPGGGGVPGSGPNGADGVRNTTNNIGSCGGGGGYYGGGAARGNVISGAPVNGGGGGGSSWVAATSTSVSYSVATATGDGLLTITPLLPPAISSFAPASGVANTSVTLTGSDLNGATSVMVNGVSVVPTAVTGTSLTFVVPAGASATQSITVTAPNGTSAPSSAFAVRLRVASTSPAANARTAPRPNSAVGLTFSEPVAAASVAPTATAGLRVYSAQVGGRKAGTAAVSGRLANYTSSLPGVRANFAPGEVVSVSVPATVQSTGGLAAMPYVYQFTTAVSRAGGGTFSGGTDPAVGSSPSSVAVGDVDGDGDLDLLTANQSNSGTVSVRLNQPPAPTITSFAPASGPVGISVTLTGTGFTGAGAVSFNGAAAASFTVVNATTLTAVVPAGATTGPLSVTTPNGTGTSAGSFTVVLTVTSFSPARNARAAPVGTAVAIGFSAAVAAGTAGNVRVFSQQYQGRRPAAVSGGGTNTVTLTPAAAFRPGETVQVTVPATVLSTAGLMTQPQVYQFTTATGGTGVGNFVAAASVGTGSNPQALALGDVNADGNLDALTVNTATAGTVSVLLGDGAGNFAPPAAGAAVAGGRNAAALALADVDNDHDLDLVVASNFTSGSVGVLLNQPPAPTLTDISPAAELPGLPVVLTGTGFTPASTVSFGGSAATVTYNSATSLTAIVLAGAYVGGAVTVSTATGTSPASASPAFTPLTVYDGGPVGTCAAAVPATATLADGAWHYLLSSGGQVVLAYQYTGANLGSFAAEVLRSDPAAPVRQDAGGGTTSTATSTSPPAAGLSPAARCSCAYTD